MAKDYEDKMEDMLEKEEMESSEVEVEVQDETDMEPYQCYQIRDG